MSGTVGKNRPCVIEGCDRTRQRYSARCRVHIQELMTTAYRNPFTFCWHEPKGPRCYACLLEDEVDAYMDQVQASRAGGLLAPSGLGAGVERVSLQPEAPGHSGASSPGRILPSSGPELPRDVA